MTLGHICSRCHEWVKGGAACGCKEQREERQGPALHTDTNNPLRDHGRILGKPTETREDVKQREAEGIVFLTGHERKVLERRRGKARGELLSAAIDRVREREKIRL